MELTLYVLYVTTMIAAVTFGVGGILYAHADRLRLSRKAELRAAAMFVGGGAALTILAIVALLLRLSLE